MSQLKVNAISDSAGANGNAITLATDGTCTAKVTNNLSNRNLIINGAFQVAQRGTSSTASGFGSVDRWKCVTNGTDNVATHTQHALTSSDTGPWAKGFRYSFHAENGDQTSGAEAGDYIFLRYALEAQDVANSGWNYTSSSSYITLSFWDKSSVAQNFNGHIQSLDGTAQNYPFETGSLSANTWTKITKTIPGNSNLQFDNNENQGLSIRIAMFYGTNRTGSVSNNTWAAYDSDTRVPDMTSTWYTTNDATFELTGVQLEVGDTATEFEHRSYHDELLRCQRYYVRYQQSGSDAFWVSHMTAYGSSNNSGIIFLPVPMRAKPAEFATSGTAADYQFWGSSSVTDSSAVPVIRGTSGVNQQVVAFDVNGASITEGHSRILRIKAGTDAYLSWSAEI